MLPEPIKSALIEMIQLWCVDACLAAYDEFDMADPDYVSKVYDRILYLQFEAEAEIRNLKT